MGHYQLVLEFTESTICHNENDRYFFRFPEAMVKAGSQELFEVCAATATIAFRQNPPEHQKIQLNCRQRDIPGLKSLLDYFNKHSNFSLNHNLLPDSAYLKSDQVKKFCATCVDRRLDDFGADSKSGVAQLTHAGGLLLLHPWFRKDASLAPFTANLQQLAEWMVKRKLYFNELRFHTGINGEDGCGMVNNLRRNHPLIADRLHSLTGIITLYREIRESWQQIMAKDCQIIAEVVDPQNTIEQFNIDNHQDFQKLSALAEITV